MKRQKKISSNDVLNFFVSAIIGAFSLLIGGGWFIGLLLEPEKSEPFLLLVSLGLLLGGIGCSIYCLYLTTRKIYKWMYFTGLLLTVAAYVLTVLGQAIYNNY